VFDSGDLTRAITLSTMENDVVEQDEPIEEEFLVEEISIDGMCGVY
jgi:mycofactocin precursor